MFGNKIIKKILPFNTRNIVVRRNIITNLRSNVKAQCWNKAIVRPQLTLPLTITARTFSTEPTLVEALAHEMMEEEGNDEIDQELLDAQQIVLQHFDIDDTDGKGIITLTRQLGDENIKIMFDCQAGQPDDLDSYDFGDDGVNINEEGNAKRVKYQQLNDESGEYEDSDDMFSSDQGHPFEVIVSKGDSSLSFDCSASAGANMEIRGIRMITSEFKDNEDMIYDGPVFNTLVESVQTGFYDYLAMRGIDDNFSFFVLTYSKDKEQREYVNWLKTVAEFVAEK
mmetsp:Transcript_43098/g.119203  ORF Transcript_43098/g.119203 Transcript_43098/m.119203 type:complete len:282 (+) Transcript_43098:11-856(+)